MHFGNITQSPTESIIPEYTVCLKSATIECQFSCPGYQLDLVPIHVKEQFICGWFNHALQTDILAKAAHLKTLQKIIANAEAFETVLRDQPKLSGFF